VDLAGAGAEDGQVAAGGVLDVLRRVKVDVGES
jgi:hypothetical protein